MKTYIFKNTLTWSDGTKTIEQKTFEANTIGEALLQAQEHWKSPPEKNANLWINALDCIAVQDDLFDQKCRTCE